MPGKNLTREEARARAANLSVHRYDVELDLATSQTTFSTRSTVTFSCSEPGSETFIDFLGDSIQWATLNDVPIDVTGYEGTRLTVADLQAENELVVSATGRYMNTGEGLHRFVDPVDAEVYLYTQFEVADCRRMFPVFDQPDIKARFAFTVTAPARWEIISNQATPEPVDAGLRTVGDDTVELATWSFAPTPPISSYITALIAGPYAVVRDEVVTREKTVPLGVFCRKSLLPHLDAADFLDCTKRGFAFFEEIFDVPFPFDKYDQVFTPEYNMGAMENAGAVTFNEVYVFRARVPDSLVERRALTVLHELAHMWFGNLVTMRWWDDLWLNESFAEWASTTCQAEATQWRSAWTTFAIAEKGWAYRQDQLSSTHPIVANIRHLEDVELNFDGITYAKGASVLKQLVAYVGREEFVAGLRAYFRKHAWGNTTLADLLAELARTSGRDLETWSRVWLETAGVNTLRAELATDADDIITEAAIVQTAPAEHPTLRPHRLSIGLYDAPAQDRPLARVGLIHLDVDGPRTPVEALVGRHRPDLMLVNDDDLAYAKIRLDDKTLHTVVTHPVGVADSLPRALLLGAAWDMTRDAEMAARDYLHLALRALPQVTDSTQIRILLAQLQTAVQLYVDRDAEAAVLAELTARLRELLVAAQPGGDAQLQFMTAYAGLASEHADLAWLADILAGDADLPGLVVDTEMRWTLVTALAAGHLADDAAIAAELARDNTATGRERAARARAARPTPQAKAEAWRLGVVENGLPNQTVDAIWQGFMRVSDVDLVEDLLGPYVARYHEALESVWASRTLAIAESVVGGFYPSRLASPELLRATQDWLDSHAHAPDGLIRLVSENRDTVSRALAAQQKDAAEHAGLG